MKTLAAVVAMLGASIMPADAADEPKPPYTETMNLREYIVQNKGEKLLNPIPVHVYWKDVKGEKVLCVKDGGAFGTPRFIDVNSEFKDSAGVVWVVVKYVRNVPEVNRPHYCTVKKKDVK